MALHDEDGGSGIVVTSDELGTPDDGFDEQDYIGRDNHMYMPMCNVISSHDHI